MPEVSLASPDCSVSSPRSGSAGSPDFTSNAPGRATGIARALRYVWPESARGRPCRRWCGRLFRIGGGGATSTRGTDAGCVVWQCATEPGRPSRWSRSGRTTNAAVPSRMPNPSSGTSSPFCSCGPTVPSDTPRSSNLHLWRMVQNTLGGGVPVELATFPQRSRSHNAGHRTGEAVKDRRVRLFSCAQAGEPVGHM